MRIEFRYWPGNTEVILIEDLVGYDHTVDRFYTSAKATQMLNSSDLYPWDSRMLFDALQDMLPWPVFGEPLGHLHPYWAEHPEQAKRMRAAREDVT